MEKKLKEYLRDKEYIVDNEEYFSEHATIDLSYSEMFKQLDVLMQVGVYIDFFKIFDVYVNIRWDNFDQTYKVEIVSYVIGKSQCFDVVDVSAMSEQIKIEGLKILNSNG